MGTKEQPSPLVSVIVPCYNHGAYIEEALQSVLMQSYGDCEIIVVNDGSTCEKTNRLLNSISLPRTTILHTPNQGIASARNHGIEHAKGKYILPLDADDKIGSNYISEAVSVLEQDPEIGIVYSRGEFIGELARPIDQFDYSLEQMLFSNMIFCSGLFRTDDWKLVGGYKADMKYCLEDYDFWLSLISLGRKVHRLPDCHFFYRIKRRSRNMDVSVDQYVEMRMRTYSRHHDLYMQNMDQCMSLFFAHFKRSTPVMPLSFREKIRVALNKGRKNFGQLFRQSFKTRHTQWDKS